MQLPCRRGQCSTVTLFLGKWGWYGVELASAGRDLDCPGAWLPPVRPGSRV